MTQLSERRQLLQCAGCAESEFADASNAGYAQRSHRGPKGRELSWSSGKDTPTDFPEGALIGRPEPHLTPVFFIK